LFKLFSTVFVPEQVLDEVRSEETISWITRGLTEGVLALYTPVASEIEEARQLIERSHLHPQLPSMELPEALCLVAGRRRGYIVLTENRAALLAPRVFRDYGSVSVWRALEVILEAVKTGILEADCNRPGRVFEEYASDTLHVFPTKALQTAVEEVRRICGMRGSSLTR